MIISFFSTLVVPTYLLTDEDLRMTMDLYGCIWILTDAYGLYGLSIDTYV